LTYPELLFLESMNDYRRIFESTYCVLPIQTFDRYAVRFRKDDFDHAFFESSGRRGEKDLFSKLRAQRIHWIRATLEDTDAELFQGWDAKRKAYNSGRRVALVKGNYVVVISLQPDQKARFVMAYVADSETTLEKIKCGVKWISIWRKKDR